MRALVAVGTLGMAWLVTFGPPDHLKVSPHTLQITLLGLFVGFFFRTSSELLGATLRGHLITWPDGVVLFVARLVFVLLLVWGDSTTSLQINLVAVFFAISEACAAALNVVLFFAKYKTLAPRRNDEANPATYPWKKLLSELSVYGMLFVASSFMFRVGMLFAGEFLSAEQMGVFAVLHRLNEFSLFFPEAIAAVLLPFWTQRKAEGFSKHTGRMVLLMSLVGVLMGAAATLIGPWVLPALFPKEAHLVSGWLWVLMPLFALQFSNQTLLAHLMASHREAQALRWLAIAGAVAITGLFLVAQNALLHLVAVLLIAEAVFTVGAMRQGLSPMIQTGKLYSVETRPLT